MIEMNWFCQLVVTHVMCCPMTGSINRAPSHAYLAQVARACEELGFDALLTPCGTGCEDAWLATASLIALTSRIKFLVAFRPALLTPTLAAQMASTFQRMSNGRCLVNIVTGAEQAELARFGVTEDKETRYERTGEFIEVMRGAWSGEPFNYRESISKSQMRRHVKYQTRYLLSISVALQHLLNKWQATMLTCTCHGARHQTLLKNAKNVLQPLHLLGGAPCDLVFASTPLLAQLARKHGQLQMAF